MAQKQSKYAQKGKFRYSELYYDWQKAIKAGRMGEAARIGIEHTMRFLGREGVRNAGKGNHAST